MWILIHLDGSSRFPRSCVAFMTTIACRPRPWRPWRLMCQAQRWQQALQSGLTAMRMESIEPNVISFCGDLGGRFGLWLPSGYVKIATELLNMACEIVSCPIKNIVIVHSHVNILEGNHRIQTIRIWKDYLCDWIIVNMYPYILWLYP